MIAVIGGGITGQLVMHAFRSVTTVRVFDWGPPPSGKRALTRSFGANYLWAPLPDIECVSFPVVTHVDWKEPTPDSIRAYKQKIGKEGDQGNWGLQFAPESTGWDFAEPLKMEVEYGTRIVEVDPVAYRLTTSKGELIPYDYLVSTIPLYAFLLMLPLDAELRSESRELTQGRLNAKPIYVKIIQRPPDSPYPPEIVYVNYLSSDTIDAYRFCDRDQDRHYESLTSMSVTPSKKLIPGKLLPPYPDADAVEAMFARWHIALFGRYANWRPDELVHETYDRILRWRQTL